MKAYLKLLLKKLRCVGPGFRAFFQIKFTPICFLYAHKHTVEGVGLGRPSKSAIAQILGVHRLTVATFVKEAG